MTLAPDRPVDDRPQVGCPRRRSRADDDRPGAAPGAPAAEGEAAPQLAEGVTLLGEYAGTGYTEQQYLARRPGGQLVQLSHLLHLVADACDGARGHDDIAEAVSHAYGRTVSADNVRTLIGKLRALGVLAAADGSSPPVQEADPLLGLKLRGQLLGPAAVRRLARLARPLFWPPVVVAVVAGLLAVDGWLFFVHGVSDGLRATVEQPLVFLLVGAAIVVSAALHELGHAAACSYGGAKPGGMGAGVYVVWPAFYTDVTEAYQLDRRGRLRTDLGGIYVNAMIVIGFALLYAVTRYEPLVLLCFLLQIQVLQQLLPFLRLDGYYIVSDLVGVPDLFKRIGPVLRSAIPLRPAEPEVAELKPWVRRVVAGWVFVLVPVLALNLGYFLLAAPRIAATSWDSAARFVGQITTGDGATAAFASVQLLLLLLPTVGITYTLTRIARRGASGAWSWSSGSAGRRALVLTGAGAVVSVLAVAWWPDARLAPYREGERGTVQQQVRELSSFRSGEPVLRSPSDAQERLPRVEPGTSAVLTSDVQPAQDAPAPAEAEPAPSASPVPSPTTSPSASPGATPTPTPSSTPTATQSSMASPTPTSSASPTPSAAASPTATSTSTGSSTSTSTPAPSPVG